MKNTFQLGVKHQIFNNEVRSRRLALGLSQKAFAVQCGIGAHVICQVETFKKFPSPEIAHRIANVLDAPIDALFPYWLTLYQPERTTVVTTHEIDPLTLSDGAIQHLLVENTDEEYADKVDSDLMKEALINALNILSDRQRQVLELRFGLINHKAHTLKEVGEYFGTTRERIRQIEKKAIKKLRTQSPRLQAFI